MLYCYAIALASSSFPPGFTLAPTSPAAESQSRATYKGFYGAVCGLSMPRMAGPEAGSQSKRPLLVMLLPEENKLRIGWR